ncbi:MAG TPA: diaminopimelate decarboxylase, partial [Treponemataceae bacterium]|nr:diaminopimelate decarboxylase [Treponemataceae bacterium]
MSDKTFPLKLPELTALSAQYPTPFYLYDEKAIRDHAKRFVGAFKSRFPSFREYFAVKACPNPFILKILASEGLGADCSSLPELILAQKAGITGENVMFTSNETPEKEYVYANLMSAIINLDDISHIDFLERHAGLPRLICFRYNPGPERTGNAIIGNPSDAKYGLTKEQLFHAYQVCKEKGVKRFGLHTMVASNELQADYFVETARML